MSAETINVAIRNDLHKRCKVRAVNEGKSLQELVEQMLAFALANMGRKK